MYISRINKRYIKQKEKEKCPTFLTINLNTETLRTHHEVGLFPDCAYMYVCIFNKDGFSSLIYIRSPFSLDVHCSCLKPAQISGRGCPAYTEGKSACVQLSGTESEQ